MKKIIILLAAFLFISSVYADMNVEVNMDSDDEPINVWTNPNSGEGDTKYYINGIEFGSTVDDMNERINVAGDSGMDMRRVWRELTETWFEYNTIGREWEPVNTKWFEKAQYNFRKIMEYVFVPRVELEKTYGTELERLNLEILTLQKLFSEKDLCDARMEVAVEHNIKKVICDGEVYTRILDDFVQLEQVKNEKSEKPKVKTEAELRREQQQKDFEEMTRKHQEDMCDKGYQNFCQYLEKQ